MELCYIPSIILCFLGLLIIILSGRIGMNWRAWIAGPILASPTLFFAILSFSFCKKGYKKMAWFMPLIALIVWVLMMLRS